MLLQNKPTKERNTFLTHVQSKYVSRNTVKYPVEQNVSPAIRHKCVRYPVIGSVHTYKLAEMITVFKASEYQPLTNALDSTAWSLTTSLTFFCASRPTVDGVANVNCNCFNVFLQSWHITRIGPPFRGTQPLATEVSSPIAIVSVRPSQWWLTLNSYGTIAAR